jgi:hypothetical protein
MRTLRHPFLPCAAFLGLAGMASAQWTSNPALNTPIGVAANDQAVPKLGVTSDGRTWYGWFDGRSGAYTVYVQLLDAAGVPQFPANGLLVSSQPQSTSLVDWDLDVAANGDVVLVFTDARAGTDLDVYAYRISPSGNFVWGAHGVTLSTNGEFEPSPRCAVLDDGSTAFVWGRMPSSGTGSIRVQILDAAGTPRFPMDGFGISGLTNERPGFADVVPAPGGAYIVSFLRNTASFTSPRHIKAQKFNSAGTAQWNSGTPISVFDASAVPIAYWPVVRADGQGGAVFAWHYAPGNVFQSFVQKITSAGAEVFPHNGVAVSLEAGVMKLEPAIDVVQPSGDVVVCFNRRNTAQSQWGVGAQRISAAGVRSWTDNGVVLEPLDSKNESFQRIVALGDDAICAWFDNPNTPIPDARIMAQRVNASGVVQWAPTNVVVSSQAPTTAAKDDLEVVLTPSGSVCYAWDDNRSDPNGDIYAQRLNADGTLGAPPCPTPTVYCTAATNSTGASAHIGWSGSTSVAANSFTLTASSATPSTSGIFFYAPSSSAGTPFRNGFLCITGGIVRFGIVNTDASGAVSYSVNFGAPPTPTSQITAGSAWSFQFWYRDPSVAPGFSNTTDALRATFCP